jgi:hypothetical protein
MACCCGGANLVSGREGGGFVWVLGATVLSGCGCGHGYDLQV